MYSADADGRGRTRTDADGRGRTMTDADGRGRTRTDADGRGRTRTDADGRGRTRTDADGRGRTRTFLFFILFFLGIHRSTGLIGARPRVRPLGSPPPPTHHDPMKIYSLPVSTSTKIYTIRRSTCLTAQFYD